MAFINAQKSMRIAEFAFAQAKAEGRKKITAVHKANIMKLAPRWGSCGRLYFLINCIINFYVTDEFFISEFVAQVLSYFLN
jgi:hypothetical protein